MKYKTFSHDYGGALKLYYYLKGKNIKSCDYNLTGPSYKLFKRYKSTFNKLYLSDDQINWIVTSTSFPSSYEFKKLQKYKNLKTRVVFDNWTNFDIRLKRDDNLFIPDEIIVFDIYAQKLALNIFNTDVILEEDFEAKFIEEKYKNNRINKDIIFVSEPLRQEAKNLYNDERYYGFDEFDCFDEVTSRYGKDIKIKLHPLEKKNKYGLAINYIDSDIETIISPETRIIGIKSTALIKANILSKKVYRFNPTNFNFPFSPVNALQKL